MTISVVIPAYNEERYIGECIESILKHAPGNLVEILVVCNACTDRTGEVAARYPMVRVLQEPRKGTGYARHKGFEEAKGDVLAYIDADSRISPEWFPRIVREFSENPSLSTLSGPYKFYDLPEWKMNFLFTCWVPIAKAEYARGKFGVVGGNFVVRRTALEQVGGFDTSIPFWGDDAEIGRRLKPTGDVKFDLSFFNYSSARRLKGQGFLTAGVYYAANYVSQAYFQKTLTAAYGERPWDVAPGVRTISRAGRWTSVVAKAKRYVRSSAATR